jgi:hypothetical protein
MLILGLQPAFGEAAISIVSALGISPSRIIDGRTAVAGESGWS